MIKKAFGILLGNKDKKEESILKENHLTPQKINSNPTNSTAEVIQTKQELTQQHINILNKAFNELKNKEGITTIAELALYLKDKYGFKASDFIGVKNLKALYSEIGEGNTYVLTQDTQKTHITYVAQKIKSQAKSQHATKTISQKEQYSWSPLFDFAWFKGGYETAINGLRKIAIQEEWGENNKYLKSYIEYRFKITIEKYPELLSFTEDKSKACFNTGLLTRSWRDIYAYFEKKPVTFKDNDKEIPYCFVAFADSNHHFASKTLPDAINFFTTAEDIYFDASLEIKYNEKHILKDNLDRFPEKYKGLPLNNMDMLFQGFIANLKKRIQRNYRTAIPQWYNGSLCFLLPIFFEDYTLDKPDLLLTCTKKQDYYWIATCLTPEMAYRNARIIAKPESDWLKP